jgi:hypothetical protein
LILILNFKMQFIENTFKFWKNIYFFFRLVILELKLLKNQIHDELFQRQFLYCSLLLELLSH